MRKRLTRNDGTETRQAYNHTSPFKIVIAETPQEIDRCLKLRYDIYCSERGWHDDVFFDEKREFDRFDARSKHILIHYKPLSLDVGTTRLVLPTGRNDTNEFPLEEVSPSPLNELPPHIDINNIGEISRFSVSNSNNWATLDDHGGRLAKNSQMTSMVSLHIVRGAIWAAQARGIDYLCGAMEPRFIRLLASVGVRFTPLGPLQAYHGYRQPAFVPITDIRDTMAREKPEIFDFVFDQSNTPTGTTTSAGLPV